MSTSVAWQKRPVAAALCGGLAAALLLLSMPVGLIETLVASSGVSEAWTAAAPPLGIKARILLAGFGAFMAVGLIWASHRQQRPTWPDKDENRRRNSAAGVTIMGFALSKLGWLARGRNDGSRQMSRPAQRRMDSHPDAPARAPIFASRDFGGLEIFPRIASGPVVSADPVAVLQDLPSVREDVPAADTLSCLDRSHEAVDAEFEEISAPALMPSAALQMPDPVAGASLGELAARLEKGLALRARRTMTSSPTVLADMPAEQPVAVRDHVDENVDQALRAALVTLRSMAARTR